MAGIFIKSEREYLREICAKIDSGEYAIPVFQRDYVWKKEQILEFFDSIFKGYPIGSVMLWHPQENLKSKDILTDEIREQPVPSYYILDGRQRLTTFYGCISRREKKDIFKLSYNLETESFEYARKERLEVMLVSDIYDTFVMLEKLQHILSVVDNPEKRRKYVENARRLNSVLQGYVIGEMLLDGCSLDEASIVFTRINSKGTDISKTFMLQAISYKQENGLLLSKEIEGILRSLQPYGFDKLSQDDILNCFFRWHSGKNFYDVQIRDMEGVDFTTHLAEIRDTILSTVRFLHDECHVLSAKILPYTKQFIALSWFFKEFRQPTAEQRAELKRWFYYTTSCQSFQNSSLSNVRLMFRRFEQYVVGKKGSAFDYEPVRLDKDFDFRFRLGSAQTCFMALSFIERYRRCVLSGSGLHYDGYCKFYRDSPEFYFIYLSDQDRAELHDIFAGKGEPASVLAKYMLDAEMMESLNREDYEAFSALRKKMIVKEEYGLLEGVGLACLE